MDFNFITSRLACGATIPDPMGTQTLVKAGVTHIINCQKEHDTAPFLVGHPLKYLRCPTADDGERKGDDWFGPGIKFALEALAVPHTKVYVHCMAGINRGPSMAYAIMRAQGFDARLARALIKDARPEVLLHYRHDADVVIKALGYE